MQSLIHVQTVFEFPFGFSSKPFLPTQPVYIHEHHQPWPTEVTSPRRWYQSEVAMLTHGGGARFAFLFPHLLGDGLSL